MAHTLTFSYSHRSQAAYLFIQLGGASRTIRRADVKGARSCIGNS